MAFWVICKIAQPIQPIWQHIFALPCSALKKPPWEFNFFHIFGIPSSSRHEKLCQMLQTLFWLFQCSRNPQCTAMFIYRNKSNRFLIIKENIHIFFQAHFFSPKILQHYCLIWLSIITSPKGKQLDFWLFLAVFMDCAPVVISIYNTINYALWLRNMGKVIYDFIMTSSV